MSVKSWKWRRAKSPPSLTSTSNPSILSPNDFPHFMIWVKLSHIQSMCLLSKSEGVPETYAFVFWQINCKCFLLTQEIIIIIILVQEKELIGQKLNELHAVILWDLWKIVIWISLLPLDGTHCQIIRLQIQYLKEGVFDVLTLPPEIISFYGLKYVRLHCLTTLLE